MDYQDTPGTANDSLIEVLVNTVEHGEPEEGKNAKRDLARLIRKADANPAAVGRTAVLTLERLGLLTEPKPRGRAKR